MAIINLWPCRGIVLPIVIVVLVLVVVVVVVVVVVHSAGWVQGPLSFSFC